MIDLTTLSLKLEYIFGCMGYYPCVRAEITNTTDGADRTVFYKIDRYAMLQYLLEHLDNADVAEIVEELIQPGVIFFFNEDEYGEYGQPNKTVKIEQVENVWAKLKGTIAARSIPAASPATTKDTDTADTDETVNTAVSPGADAEKVEEADTAGSAESAMAEETADNTVDINESVEEVADDESAVTATEPATVPSCPSCMDRVVGHWDTAIVILGSDVVGEEVETDFIINLLREKIIQAGKYEVTVLSNNTQNIDTADAEATPDQAGSDETDDNVVGNDEADETVVAASEEENTSDSVNTVVTAESDEAAESEETAEETEDEEAERDEQTERRSLDNEITITNAILFVIKEILHHKVFDFPEHPDPFDDPFDAFGSRTKAKIEAMRALKGKHMFLRNKNKDVEAEGVMLDDGKRIIVIAGSTVNEENRLPNQKGQGSSATLREKLIDDGVILDCKFTKDYEFNSTSAAASVILGQSANGLTSWKDENGIKLETLLGRG